MPNKKKGSMKCQNTLFKSEKIGDNEWNSAAGTTEVQKRWEAKTNYIAMNNIFKS